MVKFVEGDIAERSDMMVLDPCRTVWANDNQGGEFWSSRPCASMEMSLRSLGSAVRSSIKGPPRYEPNTSGSYGTNAKNRKAAKSTRWTVPCII